MRIESSGLVNGIIADRFGSKGEQFSKNGMSNRSLPLTIVDAPSDAVSFAIIIDDKDAIPVCGFSWIHWAAVTSATEIKENASVLKKDMVQGVNSYHSKASDLSREEATGYGGPDPPNEEHVYDIAVYALDSMLDLKEGFFMNELWKAMDGHIVAHAVIKGTYSPKE